MHVRSRTPPPPPPKKKKLKNKLIIDERDYKILFFLVFFKIIFRINQ